MEFSSRIGVTSTLCFSSFLNPFPLEMVGGGATAEGVTMTEGGLLCWPLLITSSFRTWGVAVGGAKLTVTEGFKSPLISTWGFEETEAISEAATEIGICSGGGGCTFPVGVTVTDPPEIAAWAAACAAAAACMELFVIVTGSDSVCGGGREEVFGKAKMRFTLPPSDVK